MYADSALSSPGKRAAPSATAAKGASGQAAHQDLPRCTEDGGQRGECGAFNTLRTRVLVLVGTASLACLLALAMLMLGSVRHFGMYALYQQCSSIAAQVVSLHPDLMTRLADDRMGLRDQLRAYLLVQPHVAIQIVDGRGDELLSTGYGGSPTPTTRFDLTAIQDQLTHSPDSPIKIVDPTDAHRPQVLSARPVSADPNGPWVVVTARTTAVAMEMSDIVKAYLLKTGGIATTLALVVGLILTMGVLAILTRPLIFLTRRIDQLRNNLSSGSALSLDDFPFTARRDEIGHLARAFRDTFSRLREETSRVQTTDVRRRDMVASVSHDLRTPLTALMGQLEVVRTKEATLPLEERNRLIDAAFNNAQQLKRLTDALSELGRLENPELVPEFEPIAVHELCDDVASRFMSRAMTQSQSLVVDFPDRLPLARVDAQLLDRALGNLIDNAMRVTPAGGEVRVDLRTERIAGIDAIRIAVRDTGPGVAPEDRARVFERFYQGGGSHRANRGSSGLGLAIVSRVAELHHGRAGLEHPAQGGACFFLVLPLDPDRGEIPTPAQPA
jgi:signal transduction histidine kinase